ncbi:M10 family metallopeptidase C-terminal domain-containing protein [Pseudomonas sp. MWU15-20650]|uniref:M10 family metallopeptidase C-terminal domain-containing protein n=1 Tax=Pseudomonas sp. MWU15-20650 TaxID=2933107 RepID=UPI00200D732D|nr:M10 family metallopeptidase C-terminal domain-containing protein [Pseudomonas sp. MWU15-20650]
MFSVNPNTSRSPTLSTYAHPQPGVIKDTSLPSYTTDKAARNMLRTSVARGFKWQDKNRDGVIDIAYEFFTPTDPRRVSNVPKGASALNEDQKTRARAAMQAWSDVARIKFSENSASTEGRLTLGLYAGDGESYASLPFPRNVKKGGEAWLDEEHAQPQTDRHDRQVIAHEVGHSLGLDHPGDYTQHPPTRHYLEDTQAYSLMSYNPEIRSGQDFSKNGEWTHYPAAPMMHDIAAVQALYGANYKTRRGDTVYGFNSNTERDYFSLTSSRDAPVFCIWDGGGNDTLDCSGFNQKQTLNLNAETLSDVGGMKGNVSIAKGVTVENAIGGAHHDTLIGNNANNRLKGGGGADTLTGGGGADVFVYDKATDSTAANADLITDFVSGTDKIDLNGLSKDAHTPLRLVHAYTGRIGDTLVRFNPYSGRYFVAIDLTGNGQTDFLVKSTRLIRPQDINGLVTRN